MVAAVLGAAALAGPAAAGQQGTHESVKANVYVPPGALSTAAPRNDGAQTNVHVEPTPSASSSGFDWGSAGIGAAVVIGALLIVLGGAAGLRSRRQIQQAATG